VTRVVGVGLLTGWGVGAAALPADARAAAAGRRVIPLAPPPLDRERFRRATRECLLGVAAVEAMLADAGLSADAIGGPDTALVYATAAAYGSSNRLFIDGGRGPTTGAEPSTLQTVGAGAARLVQAEGGLSRAGGGSVYFPYTAPSAVPAEVAIEYRLSGGYVILVGGATAGVEALWQAATLLRAGRCERAVVLTVETFAECENLWARGRWAVRRPLVEAAACALLDGDGDVRYAAAAVPAPLETLADRRAGETLACGPLVGLALARDAGDERASLTGHWRGRRMGVTLALATAGSRA
jgi:beta-ketoacyl synthase-like protein